MRASKAAKSREKALFSRFMIAPKARSIQSTLLASSTMAAVEPVPSAARAVGAPVQPLLGQRTRVPGATPGSTPGGPSVQYTPDESTAMASAANHEVYWASGAGVPTQPVSVALGDHQKKEGRSRSSAAPRSSTLFQHGAPLHCRRDGAQPVLRMPCAMPFNVVPKAASSSFSSASSSDSLRFFLSRLTCSRLRAST
jgi:hypothetical protein